MNWQDSCEIVLGLLLNGNILPDHVDATRFMPPYDTAVKLLKGGAELAELYDKVGLVPIKSATTAVNMIGDDARSKPGEFIKVLEQAYGREELANTLDRQSKRLRRGDDADLLAIEGAMEQHLNLEHRYETADKIEPFGGAWVKTGYKPLDRHMGGLPKSGLTTVAATTGIGKTTFLVQLAGCMAKRKKKVLIYTLEQTKGQIVQRILETVVGKGEDDSFRQYIKICDEQMNVNELCAEASRICAVEEIGFIGVDFVDLLLSSEETEPSVGHIYRSMAQLAKKSGVPVVLIAQLHRYEGGEPRINNIRWSGLSECVSAMILLLYNPTQTYGIGAKKDSQLPIITDKAWMIVGKSRFGFKEGGVGAIQVDWNSLTGWGTEDSSWRSMTM